LYFFFSHGAPAFPPVTYVLSPDCDYSPSRPEHRDKLHLIHQNFNSICRIMYTDITSSFFYPLYEPCKIPSRRLLIYQYSIPFYQVHILNRYFNDTHPNTNYSSRWSTLWRVTNWPD